MSIEQNKATVRRDDAEVWTRGNTAVIDEIYTARVMDHDPLPGLQATGRELQKQTVKILHTAFPDFRSHIDQMVAEGDMVATRVTVSGKNTGPFLDMPPTGKSAT